MPTDRLFTVVRKMKSRTTAVRSKDGKEVTVRNRVRNSPTIREIILVFLAQQPEPLNLSEICSNVTDRATKTPRTSIFSVLTRMPEVVRTGPGVYTLSVTT